ncbi:MAG: cob(I)yrinic acid a,c-diamide adenosyltransferase [bacterium]|nr:cob(I)yrinic acid a,c-diamide adenosyltransferase [bacterium]
MVKLNKIYTRTGDDGTTGLAMGSRVRKDSPRVQAYGTVDEANAAVGVALTHCCQSETLMPRFGSLLQSIQHDMFDLGADLATPIEGPEAPGTKLRVVAPQTERLERAIDGYNEHLAPLNSFVLPGGSMLAASLHVARTVTRRAERDAVTLMMLEPTRVNVEAIRYLNRLSDLLFVMSRAANENGKTDVLWKPGANR